MDKSRRNGLIIITFERRFDSEFFSMNLSVLFIYLFFFLMWKHRLHKILLKTYSFRGIFLGEKTKVSAA